MGAGGVRHLAQRRARSRSAARTTGLHGGRSTRLAPSSPRKVTSLDVGLWHAWTCVLAESSGAETASVEVNLPLVALEEDDGGRSPRRRCTGSSMFPGTATGSTSKWPRRLDSHSARRGADEGSDHAVRPSVAHSHRRGRSRARLLLRGSGARGRRTGGRDLCHTVDDVGAQFGTYRIEVQ